MIAASRLADATARVPPIPRPRWELHARSTPPGGNRTTQQRACQQRKALNIQVVTGRLLRM